MRGYLTDPSAAGGLRFDTELPAPAAGPHEALVAVEAFSLNPGELLSMSARARDWRPGRDVAGTVIAAAADGSGPAVGTRVVGIVDEGAWADRAAVATHRLAPLPDPVTATVAASLPTAGLTALRALREGGSVLGERVLVTAATGGVGQFAIQLARAAGAHVTALVSRPDSVEEATAAGAHTVLTDLADGPGGYRLALDGAGGEVLRTLLPKLAPHGVVATYGAVAGPAMIGFTDLHAALDLRIIGFVHALPIETQGHDLGVLAELVAAGSLAPRLGLVDDWSQIAKAIAAIGGHQVRGKAVLTVDG